MNTTNRFWHVGAAAGLALLAVLLTTFYVTNYKRHVQHSESQVHRARRLEGHPCRHARQRHPRRAAGCKQETVARRQVVPGAISSADQVRGLIATQPTYAGEQVTARRFGTPSERGVRAQIQGTQRAVQIAGDPNQVLAGTLRAGDHVDIVGGWDVVEHRGTTKGVGRARHRPGLARALGTRVARRAAPALVSGGGLRRRSSG